MRLYTPPDIVPIPKDAKRAFAGFIFDIYQWPQEMFDGTIQTYEMARRPDSVNIIAVHEGKIILNKESQPHAGEFLALPAGMHDRPDENELEGAKRELLEETGCTFKNWKLITAEAHSKKIDQVSYTFLATELESMGDQQLDAYGEQIEVTWVSFEELKAKKTDLLMRSYPAAVLDPLSSLDELLALPSLFEY